ncbi:MAG: carboxypeptidase regulatory-like domain-containing protein [Terriglobia bacterium]
MLWQKHVRLLVHGASLLVAFWFLPAVVSAQDVTGKIEGSLRDQQGAAVTTGTITATHLHTGFEKSTHPDDNGRFVFNLMPIGTYRITVNVDKFATIVREPVTLNVNDTLNLLFDLKVGSTQETIEIKSDAQQVELVSNAIGKVTTEKEILDLPLNGRNFAQLGLLQPGAAPMTPGLAQSGGALRAGQMYSINGLRPESNNFLIDGGRNMNNVDSGFALKPPLDSIAEFRILTGGVPPNLAKRSRL